MLFKSQVFTQASGSVGGLVYSHNRGGMYTRARTIPTNPSSEYQQLVRAAMGTLAPYWADTLDAGKRAAWNEYAANVAMTNKIGDTVYLTGQQHFIRCNVPRIVAGIAIIEAAPTTYNLGTFTAPTISGATDTPEISIAFSASDAWATAAGGYLLAFAGMGQGAGRSFYKGPWRYMDKVVGAVSPPSSPQAMTPDFGLATGQLVWVQCRIIQVDGRLSLPIVLGPEVVA
jgi:hypothetical protein